jgi:RecB family exonuclease
MRQRDDVASLFSSGTVLHEVPFSFAAPDDGSGAMTLLRGAIDCLVIRPDGSVAVIEFKTGRRRKAHQQQLELYVKAARDLVPGARVEGHLVYP